MWASRDSFMCFRKVKNLWPVPNLLKVIYFLCGPGWLSRYSDLLQFAQSRDGMPVGGEIFRTRPKRLCDPPILLYSGYWVFPGGKSGRA